MSNISGPRGTVRMMSQPSLQPPQKRMRSAVNFHSIADLIQPNTPGLLEEQSDRADKSRSPLKATCQDDKIHALHMNLPPLVCRPPLSGKHHPRRKQMPPLSSTHSQQPTLSVNSTLQGGIAITEPDNTFEQLEEKSCDKREHLRDEGLKMPRTPNCGSMRISDQRTKHKIQNFALQIEDIKPVCHSSFGRQSGSSLSGSPSLSLRPAEVHTPTPSLPSPSDEDITSLNAAQVNDENDLPDLDTEDSGRVSDKKARTMYKSQQVYVLEQFFRQTHYPDPVLVEKLASDLRITECKIKVWFQNKRARWRRKAFVSETETLSYEPAAHIPYVTPSPAGHHMHPLPPPGMCYQQPASVLRPQSLAQCTPPGYLVAYGMTAPARGYGTPVAQAVLPRNIVPFCHPSLTPMMSPSPLAQMALPKGVVAGNQQHVAAPLSSPYLLGVPAIMPYGL